MPPKGIRGKGKRKVAIKEETTTNEETPTSTTIPSDPYLDADDHDSEAEDFNVQLDQGDEQADEEQEQGVEDSQEPATKKKQKKGSGRGARAKDPYNTKEACRFSEEEESRIAAWIEDHECIFNQCHKDFKKAAMKAAV